MHKLNNFILCQINNFILLQRLYNLLDYKFTFQIIQYLRSIFRKQSNFRISHTSLCAVMIFMILWEIWVSCIDILIFISFWYWCTLVSFPVIHHVMVYLLLLDCVFGGLVLLGDFWGFLIKVIIYRLLLYHCIFILYSSIIIGFFKHYW